MPLSVFLFVLFCVFIVLVFLSAMCFLPIVFVTHVFYENALEVCIHIKVLGKKIRSIVIYPKEEIGNRKAGSRDGHGGLTPVLSLVKTPQLKNVETAFFVDCCLGLNDAAHTAVGSGVLQGIINGFLTIPANLTKVKTTHVTVTPLYNQTYFVFNGICIARSRLGNIILGFIHYHKNKKE